MEPILYGDFLSANVDNKIYAEITDHAKVGIMYVLTFSLLAETFASDNLCKPLGPRSGQPEGVR